MAEGQEDISERNVPPTPETQSTIINQIVSSLTPVLRKAGNKQDELLEEFILKISEQFGDATAAICEAQISENLGLFGSGSKGLLLFSTCFSVTLPRRRLPTLRSILAILDLDLVCTTQYLFGDADGYVRLFSFRFLHSISISMLILVLDLEDY